MAAEVQEATTLFIMKRAFRRGRVTPGDLIRATGLSPATAGRHIARAAGRYPKLVQMEGSALVPLPLANPPSFATEETLLQDLDCIPQDPLKTGLFPDELPVVQVQWVQSMPMKPGVLTQISRAIQYETVLDIVYIGLRENEQPRIRRILPLALEKMYDQWRLVAQDLEKPDGAIRVFVLSRIFEATPAQEGVPKNILQPSHHDMPEKLHLALNPRLTERQREVIARELKIKDGAVTIPSRSRHEFLRRFSDQPVSAEAVWPPVFLQKV